jgi:hypothetical protein
MTVHMMKGAQGQMVQTKCGLEFNKVRFRAEWTTSNAETTCNSCLEAMAPTKENQVGPLASRASKPYNNHVSEQQALSPETERPIMARRQEENTVEETIDPSEVTGTAEEATAEETPTAEAAKPAKKTKAPVPEGWETPVQFAKRISTQEGVEVRPQIVYGYVKNNKEFPHDKNSDGAVIVHIEKALAWYEGLKTRRAERAAKKAAAPATPATTDAEAPTPVEA